jgi:pimeloyl-ACP methyl ester carboxylesterase
VHGAGLHVRLHEAAAQVRLLLFHGNGEIVSDYDGAAAQFAEAGCALAVCDYRGYGASSGVPTLRNTLSDAYYVLRAVAKADPRPIVVMGRSLGGVCAAELMKPGTLPEGRIIGFVLESSGSNLTKLVQRRGMPAPEFTAEERATFDPVPKLAACTVPALVLHGTHDTLIRFAEAEASARALRGSKLVPVPGRGHNDISMGPLYWHALRDYLTERTRAIVA